jgi:hypothetical protein
MEAAPACEATGDGRVNIVPSVMGDCPVQPPSRRSVESGDFFRSVPVSGDAYTLKSILHDWDDERCTTILTRCRDRTRPSGKVLLIECVIPQGNDPHPGKAYRP